jgi:nicotinamidase-related amidase
MTWKTRAHLRRAVLQSEWGGPGLLVSSPALVVIDIQQDVLLPSEASGIERAAGQAEVIANAERILEAARAGNVPVIFTQEAHRRTGVDFGRELDGPSPCTASRMNPPPPCGRPWFPGRAKPTSTWS